MFLLCSILQQYGKLELRPVSADSQEAGERGHGCSTSSRTASSDDPVRVRVSPSLLSVRGGVAPGVPDRSKSTVSTACTGEGWREGCKWRPEDDNNLVLLQINIVLSVCIVLEMCLRGLPHCKLIQVSFPHENSTLIKELLNHCSTVWRNVVYKTESRGLGLSMHPTQMRSNESLF